MSALWTMRAVRDRLFIKAPGSADRTMWHQDQPLTQEAPGDLVVLWIPLVIDEGAAPLRVARASQHGKVLGRSLG